MTSAAGSRDEYIRRPDLGRSLPVDAASALRRSGVDRCDLAFVLCDGLSPRAIERYGPALVERIAAHERLGGWSIGPDHGRVATAGSRSAIRSVSCSARASSWC